MMDVRLLADNDVLIKLAQLDCFRDTLVAVNIAPKQVASLGFMLRYMGKTSADRQLQLLGDASAARRLGIVLSQVTELEPTLEQQKLAGTILKQALLAELDLDEGEVGLMAVGVDLPNADLATGDKRALRSLPRIAALETRLVVLKARFICFEQLIGRLCAKFGLKRVRTAVTTSPNADKLLSQAYDRYSSTDDMIFVQLMEHLGRKQLDEDAPGWLKPI
jgi:hypothetical protein